MKRNRVEILWTKAVCKEPGRYIGWPTVCRTAAGELVAVFSGDRDEHICPWGKVQLVRSGDAGAMWSEPVTICNSVIDDRDAGIVELADGSLLMSWFTSVAYRRYIADPAKLEPGHMTFYWRKHDEKLSPNDVEAQLGAFVRRSTDGGRTWSAPVRTPCSAPHGPILLKDGRLLYLGKTGDFDHVNFGAGPGRIAAAESRDGGCTWRVIGEIPFPATLDVLQDCHEPHAVEAAADAGVDWVSSVAPVFFGQNFPSAVRHYKAISEATDLPFMIYAYNATLVPERDIRLFDLENVKAIKYTGRDFYSCQRLRRMLGKEIAWFAGCDELLVAALAMGDTFSGGIGLNYNMIPRHFADICALCAKNDFRAAAKRQADANRLVDLVVDAFSDNWSAFKVLMKGVGIDCGCCRAPYAPLSKAQERAILARFKALGLT